MDFGKIQRRNPGKKVWSAKTHYYALRMDFHFLCRGLGTGIFLTRNPHLICDSQNQVQGVFGFYDFKVQDLCSEKSSKSGFWENTKKKSRQKDYGVQKLITMR